MKLNRSDKYIFGIVVAVHLIAIGFFLRLNQPFFLTSKTYLITQSDNRQNSIEKTLTVLINSADFNKDMGLEKPIIQAADKTNGVMELKTSSTSKQTVEGNFRTFEPKILAKLNNLNRQILITPVSNDITTQEVLPNYAQIALVSLVSLLISLSFVYLASRYIR